jgi:hypothetical protein
LRSIKGPAYVSILLSAVNNFNLHASIMCLSSLDEESLHRISDKTEETLLWNFALLSSVVYPEKSKEELGEVVNSMMTDFKHVVEASHKVVKN